LPAPPGLSLRRRWAGERYNALVLGGRLPCEGIG
jgi:hypothetical protein